jgi:molecular chaperone DnaJ
MAFKDHYQVLAVPPSASTETIKKAFRGLAMKYHPDKHNNSSAATLKFTEIREAYRILSDPEKRAAYNYERYRNLPQYAQKPLARSPEDIFHATSNLCSQLKLRDPGRIDRDILFFQLMEILSAHNLTVLREAGDQEINRQIIRNLILSATHLPFTAGKEVNEQLLALAGNNSINTRDVLQFIKQSKQQHYWNRYKIYVALAIALLVCYLMRVLIINY